MGDLISRQAAIDEIKALYEWHEIVTEDRAIDHFKRLPSAEPERKKGRWINDRLVTTNGGTYAVRRCPFCESYYQDVGYGWDYCPNCGADMRGEEK